MIAGAYGGDEWRCAGEASNWSSPIFDEWHINCTMQYCTTWYSDQRKIFGELFVVVVMSQN